MTTPQLNAPSKLYIPVAGTWARLEFRTGEWYRTDSPFDAQMTQLGYFRVDQNGDRNKSDPGFWSGDVNGLLVQKLKFWRRNDTEWRHRSQEGSPVQQAYLEATAKDPLAMARIPIWSTTSPVRPVQQEDSRRSLGCPDTVAAPVGTDHVRERSTCLVRGTRSAPVRAPLSSSSGSHSVPCQTWTDSRTAHSTGCQPAAADTR